MLLRTVLLYYSQSAMCKHVYQSIYHVMEQDQGELLLHVAASEERGPRAVSQTCCNSVLLTAAHNGNSSSCSDTAPNIILYILRVHTYTATNDTCTESQFW